MRRPILWMLALAVVAMIAASLWAARVHVADGSVLVVELGGRIEEAPPRELLAQLSAAGPALPTLLLLFDMAAADERLAAVLVHIRPLEVGYARVQELRDALTKLRASGKRVVALVDATSLNATRELYLASAADQVYLDPGSLAPLAGIAGQSIHLAGMFEKIGVRWDVARVGEYKSAVEQFAARQMSPEARQMNEALIGGLYDQVVAGIASARKLDLERVRALVDEAPGTPAELIAAQLADGVAGRKEVLEKLGLGDAEEIEVRDYQRIDPTSLGLRSGPAIALIFGDGTIVDARGRAFQRLFAADETEQALDAAAEDDEIRAVVLRINSPGGSAQASDRLWRAVQRVRAKGKPVVVSMGDAAASGGYYAASAANAIVAEPGTFTGSIGVFFLRPSVSGLYEKLEIGSEVVARGAFAAVSGSDRPFTPQQQARADSFVQAAYTDFIGRVSVGRGMETSAVDALGRGRVWLGSEAAERKLVDELGGLGAAVERARREAGIADEPDPARLILPAPRSTSEQIRELLRGELGGELLRSLVPPSLEPLAALAWLPVAGELAYLPEYWLEIR